MALKIIHDISTDNMGSLCVTDKYKSVSVQLQTNRYDGTRQKADMAALLLQEVGVNHHNGEYSQNQRSSHDCTSTICTGNISYSTGSCAE